MCNERLFGGAPEKGCLHLADAALGERAPEKGIPGVLFAAATFHFFTPGCQNNVEITQVIKQLQCPILGHWKCTFFLQINSPPTPGKGDDVSREHHQQLQVWVELQLVISEAEAHYTHVASLISQHNRLC